MLIMAAGNYCERDFRGLVLVLKMDVLILPAIASMFIALEGWRTMFG